jgi:hypothetical protein
VKVHDVSAHVEPLHDPPFAQLNVQVEPVGQFTFGQDEPAPSQFIVQVAPGAHWTFHPLQSLPAAQAKKHVAPAGHVTLPEHFEPVEHSMLHRWFAPQATSTPTQVPWLEQLYVHGPALQTNDPLHTLPAVSHESVHVADGSHFTFVHPPVLLHEKLHLPLALQATSWHLVLVVLQLKPQFLPMAHWAPLHAAPVQLVPCMH